LKEGEGKMRKMKFVFVLAVLATCALAQAAYVQPPIVNGNFELPGLEPAVKIVCWDGEGNAQTTTASLSSHIDVPSWSSDTVALDSGVQRKDETDYSGFMLGALETKTFNGYTQTGDPSTWNLLPYKIQAGDEYMLQVQARVSYNSGVGDTHMIMSLYYQDIGGARITLATQNVNLGKTKVAWDLAGIYQLYYAAPTDPLVLPVGRKLGVELYNSGYGYVGMDNVQFVPEPATLILLGLGGLLLRRKR
jgi:opacity protein-like surface antigen